MKYRLAALAAIWVLSMAVGYVAHLTQRESLKNYQLKLLAPRTVDPSIVIAGVDEEVFEKGMFNRTTHARVLDKLRECGCQLVVFDIMFDENRDPKDDKALLAALERSPGTVVAGSFATDEVGQVHLPHLAPALEPALHRGRVEIGSIEATKDEDGTFRRYFLSVTAQDKTFPSLALAAFGLLHSVRSADIRYGQEAIDVPPDRIPAVLSTNAATQVGVHTYEMYFHPPATGPGHHPNERTYPVVPYLSLLDPSPGLQTRLRGSVVFIGENTARPDDLMDTPEGTMKGVEVHAQCLDSLLHKTWYVPASPITDALVAAVLVTLVVSLGFLTWRLPFVLLAGSLLCAGALAGNLFVLHKFQLLSELAGPVTGGITAMISLSMLRLALASRFLRRFIPAEAVRGLLSARRIAQSGQATVIVTDIRGYTTLSETRTPVQMLKLLNEYHSVTVDIYHKYGGNVLTFQGDAQLVVFGYPTALKDAPGQAVKACVEVMTAIDVLRQKWGIESKANFDVGAGICTGVVYIGDIGSKEQANYTVIGETVRTSHKVQSMSTALEGNVLMDEPSYKKCLDKPNATAIPNVQLEGFPHPKTLYRVEPPEGA